MVAAEAATGAVTADVAAMMTLVVGLTQAVVVAAAATAISAFPGIRPG